jgi:hypothetical protein
MGEPVARAFWQPNEEAEVWVGAVVLCAVLGWALAAWLWP